MIGVSSTLTGDTVAMFEFLRVPLNGGPPTVFTATSRADGAIVENAAHDVPRARTSCEP
ncbi:MAG: hypothetical protein AB7O28_20100 [Vicinamibacterales bacterium]